MLERKTATITQTDLTFNSPTWGFLPLAKMLARAAAYIQNFPENKYRLVVGTDSQPASSAGRPASNGKESTDYVTAFVIHRVGAGGIYFWHRTIGPKVFNLRERIYTEALLSLQMAQILIEDFERYGLMKYDLEIHVDIGNGGETREMIAEVVGMVRGNGFKVKTKPEAYGASKVADRHT